MDLLGWFRRATRRERELDDEIRAHLAMAIHERIEGGEDPAEAEANARREFGNAILVKEVTRDMWGRHWLETLLQDLRYGLRQLRRNPGFTSVAVITLALAIGASTAAFSLLNYFVLRDLNVPHPHQLVLVGTLLSQEDYSSVSLPIFQEISEQQKIFSGMFVWAGGAGVSAETDDSLHRVDLWFVDGRYYSELGATPQIGRLIGPTDLDLNTGIFEHVAVISYGFWQGECGGKRSVVGKTLRVEGVPFTIIGVTRRDFEGMEAEPEAEITVPLTAKPLVLGNPNGRKSLQEVATRGFQCTGRLKPGVTITQARAQLEPLWLSIRNRLKTEVESATEQQQFARLYLDVEPEAQGISYLQDRFTKPLFLLLGISGAALLIACLNLASMMLSRSAARSHEMGVRVALGASRWRIARQLLIESSVLAAGGTLLGVVLADWGSRALRSFILGETMDIPVITKFGVDWRVLGFTAVAMILATLIFGFAPAWSAASEDPRVALQNGMRLSGVRHRRLGNVLVIIQVALSVSLITGAGLLIHSLENLDHVNPGFRMHGLVRAILDAKPGHHKGPDRVAYYHELTDRVSQLPGVRAAGMGSFSLGGSLWWPTESIQPQGKRYGASEADFAMAMSGFLRTAGIHLLCGRGFNWQDGARSPRVAILSENFARELAPGCEALGKSLKITSEPKWPAVQVVGIVNNASLFDIRRHFPFTVYVPLAQYGNHMRSAELYVDTNAAPAVAAKEISDAVRSLGQQYVTGFETVSGFIHRWFVDQQVTATLSGFLGGLALFLAAIGLYGLMAYSVSRRTNEIGIRMALGAPPGSIQRMILGETLRLLLAGVVIGLPCALGVARLIAHLLYGVSPDDPGTLALAVCALVSVATLGGFIPARRAARVNPMTALRHE
jgi:predicted permease